MDARQNALLAEIARDAELERTDFLARAGEQLGRFLAAHRHRVQQLGGLVLIDDDPDYLAITPDGTFRSRSRVYDESTGNWISELEIIENASDLAEIYNPADILQAFAEAQLADAGIRGDGSDAAEVDDPGAGGAGDVYAEVADQWAAGQPDVREAHDEESAALALYELALDFQDRSQRTEANLIAGFENAAAGILGYVGTISIVGDDDEHLELGAGGFRGRVIPEGDTDWKDISSPDQIVRYYDPTDVFGDLAEAIVDAYPSVADADDEADGDEKA